MKFPLIVTLALSAVAFAVPAPTINKNNDCAHQKPYVHYSDDWKGCTAYNVDELKYKLSCIWYQPKLKICKRDDHEEKDKEEKDKKEKEKVGSVSATPNAIANDKKWEKEEKERQEKAEKDKKEKEEKDRKEKEKWEEEQKKKEEAEEKKKKLAEELERKKKELFCKLNPHHKDCKY